MDETSNSNSNSYSQSTQSAATISTPPLNESTNCDNEPWGRLMFQQSKMRNLGIRKRPRYQLDNAYGPKIDLFGRTFCVGRAKTNDFCCGAVDIPPKILDQFSGIHFKLTKDVDDEFSPVYIKDLSLNGTCVNMLKIGLNKMQILLHNDKISIGKTPSVAFTFKCEQQNKRDLPPEILKKFHIGQTLGSGAYGTVYYVHDSRSCATFALKFVKKPKHAGQHLERALNEAKLLKALRHPCIIRIHTMELFDEGVAILLDVMNGGDLHTRIIVNEFLAEANAKFFFYQICAGVKYLHERRIVHRDIKPENILLATKDVNTLIKISDFGLSKLVSDGSNLRTVCGTPLFIAPEVLESNGQTDVYTDKSDIWSLGVLLFFALDGTLTNENFVAVKFSADTRHNVTKDAKTLIKKILSIASIQRPSINDVLNDPWLCDKRIIDSATKIMNSAPISHY